MWYTEKTLFQAGRLGHRIWVEDYDLMCLHVKITKGQVMTITFNCPFYSVKSSGQRDSVGDFLGHTIL